MVLVIDTNGNDEYVLLKSLVGREVVLHRDIELRSGEKYPKGKRFTIASTWRGKLTLHGDETPLRPLKCEMLRQIPLHDVRLVPR